MSNAFQSVVTDLKANLTTAEVSASSAILSFFSTALTGLAEDEIKILGDAINFLIQRKEAGDDWETALTAALNQFYSEEKAEATALAMSFLEAVGKILNGIKAVL